MDGTTTLCTLGPLYTCMCLSHQTRHVAAQLGTSGRERSCNQQYLQATCMIQDVCAKREDGSVIHRSYT